MRFSDIKIGQRFYDWATEDEYIKRSDIGAEELHWSDGLPTGHIDMFAPSEKVTLMETETDDVLPA